MQYVTVHGEDVPALGLGTWELTGRDCRRAVQQALELGYRHVDTAQAYGNEAQVGAALKATPIDRSELFVTTKVWNDAHASDDVRRSTEDSLGRLDCSYIDLLLIHWPVELERLEETLEAMLRLRDDGLVRHVGVSNFTPSQVDRALRSAPIFCNQVEYHPYLSQGALLTQARRHGFLLTAYSPLARGAVLHDPTLSEIAERHGKSPAQVVLRWLLDQEGVAVVPKATSAAHLEANLAVFDFTLGDEERTRVTALDEGRRIIDVSWVDDWER
jgi:2,5-diketo-D-gluconate reductase B